MQLLDAGPVLNRYGAGVATLTLTPMQDRAAIVTRIGLSAVSATDIWDVTIAGKLVASFRQSTVLGNNLLNMIQDQQSVKRNIFDYLRDVLSTQLIYPIPQGQSLTISSRGGATANILLAFQEVQPSDITANLLNHPNGKTFILPYYGYINAAVAAAGATALDTEIKPAWLPSIFLNSAFPSGFKLTLLSLFINTASENTYNGAANHVSQTADLRLTKNGQEMFTRDALGFAALAIAAVAGSANTTYLPLMSFFPAFGDSYAAQRNTLNPPIVWSPGDTGLWELDITGDVTGGANYADASVLALCKVELG